MTTECNDQFLTAAELADRPRRASSQSRRRSCARGRRRGSCSASRTTNRSAARADDRGRWSVTARRAGE